MVLDLVLQVVVDAVVLTAAVDPSVDEDLAGEQAVGIALLGGCSSEMDLTAMAMAIRTPLQPALLAWGCMPCAALGGWSMRGTSSARRYSLR